MKRTPVRTLYIHDNLPVLRGLENSSVDLIATDPPFNAGRVFNAPARSRAAGQTFDDRWNWNDVAKEWSNLSASKNTSVRRIIETTAVIEGGSVGQVGSGVRTGRTRNSTTPTPPKPRRRSWTPGQPNGRKHAPSAGERRLDAERASMTETTGLPASGVRTESGSVRPHLPVQEECGEFTPGTLGPPRFPSAVRPHEQREDRNAGCFRIDNRRFHPRTRGLSFGHGLLP